jgi:co-chaperonin GroES (HSP10)
MSESISSKTLEDGAIFLGRRKIGLSREDLMRASIPTIDTCPTLYRPTKNILMIVPLPDQGRSEGGLILPDRARITYNEGHIVAMGPTCILKWDLGDCVTWPQHEETKVEIEGYKFVLITETGIFMRIPKAALVKAAAEYEGCCAHCKQKGGHAPDCPCSADERPAQDGYTAADIAAEKSSTPVGHPEE